jgi:hypothetical protein
VSGTPAPRFASLGALQMRLKEVEQELNDLLYPGGCAFKQVPTGEKLKRFEVLSGQRISLKSQVEQF